MASRSHFADEKKDDAAASDANAKTSADDTTSVSSHEDHHPNKDKRKPIAVKKKTNRKGMTAQRTFFSVMRFVFLDLAVLTPLVVFTALQVVERVRDDYLMKQMDLQLWTDQRRITESTYMHRDCELESITAHDTPEIMIDPKAATQKAVEMMMIHGASVYPNLLTPETAKEVRDFIVAENKRTTDIIPVIEQNQRWSFPIRVDQHPSVAKALKEILSKDYLVNAIEGIMGPNPAVIEFTAITSAYGAKIQRMHQDVIPESSAAKFNRNYVPSYSLFIPLQNTTQAMGATHVCPGTHHYASGCNDICDVEAFHASGSADNWPMGFGALVNQQTTHRGPAHTGKGQPERVLFILTFAPRPRLAEKEVESRILGSGGSYSMHWSQWGHTLRDYADPERRMSFGWRHLKSLGIYKPWGHDWGWDYITVASQRIVHEELGFTAEDLQETYKKGKFDWLPKFLHGTVLKTDDSIEAWTTFVSETVANIKDFAKSWYFTLLATYLAVIVGGNVMLQASGFINDAPQRAFQCLRRVAFTHGAVVLLSFLYYRSVARGSWARNIRQGLQYRAFSQYYGPELLATLPNKYDVLIFDDLQSAFLASTAFVYDYTHPGNYRWMNMTKAYGGNFASLSSEMRSQLCNDLVEWQQAEHMSRILVKNDANEWATVSADMAERICQKTLMSRVHKFKSYAIKWIDSLLSEIRFGYWRESSMNRNYMQKSLAYLQDQVLGFQWKSVNKTDVLYGAEQVRSLPPFQLGSLGITRNQEPLKLPKRTALPPRPQPQEPYEGAWLQEGDVVEAIYNSYSGEFYRARIVTPVADSFVWDVEYDDGEVEEGLCARCVRPFVPYQVGEEADWTDKESDFVACKITAVTGEDSYEIQLDDGRKLKNVSASNLRRMMGGGNSASRANLAINVGMRVMAEFPDDDSGVLYPGVIHDITGKDMFAISYDDGDYSHSVPKSMIYPA